jgi:UDP-2-acetamido-2,6-beta-L-arabino-hexul-4-ose reductase
MIIGYGDIGSILTDREGALLFASGVSNSNCTDEQQFTRERGLLLAQDKSLCCFYFSSMFVEVRDTPYFNHKKKMEALVRGHFRNHNIIRLGNITFGTNPHTFINYLLDRIEKGLPCKIKNEYRYVIDKEHLVMLIKNLPLQGRNCFSAFTRMAKVKDLVNDAKPKEYTEPTNY